jgi:uncharacterized repeat protein (TIGR03803 family)
MTKLQQGSGALWLAFAAAATAIAPAQSQTTYTETVLHSFAPAPPDGDSPLVGVIRDQAGNIYGTAPKGGAWGKGVVYKLDMAGQATVLHSFTGGADGAHPTGSLIRDEAGNLYGTTAIGGTVPGAQGFGVVYKLTKAGDTTVLHTFTGGADGKQPSGGVVRDPAGNLYGTTRAGGSTTRWGVVYKVDPAGRETVLYSFTGQAGGASPVGGAILDEAGNLYGTTESGGVSGGGVVYKLNPEGQETVLYSFTGHADGGSPHAGVIRDAAGNLYGTTTRGGATGNGVVYKLDMAGHETVLCRFTGGFDGSHPVAGVIRDPAGNLYGTTMGGGSGYGVVFKLNPAGQETVLYSFPVDGMKAVGGVVRDPASNLYGTATAVRTLGYYPLGIVYKLDAAGQGTVLYSFPHGTDGGCPFGGATLDAAGNLYGTTVFGGLSDFGAVYKLDAAGRETVLYSFPHDPGGAFPYAGVIFDSAGNLYGTASGGGRSTGNCYALNGCGLIFKIDPSGRETTFYSFAGADGANPYSGLTGDSAGNFYGTTFYGGAGICAYDGTKIQGGCGVVFKLDPSGQETVLYSFTGGADGRHPTAGVVLDGAGNLYGASTYGGSGNCADPYGNTGCGIVFKLDTAGQGTVLYNFTGGADGRWPDGVILDAAGNLFGTASGGGLRKGDCNVDHPCGAVYKLDPSGQDTVLHAFTGRADGGGLNAGLILDPAGNLYGTTGRGGTADWGVVYKLDAAGRETVLCNFAGGLDGQHPSAGVVFDPAGNLYGTTSRGGEQNFGVVFKLVPQ